MMEKFAVKCNDVISTRYKPGIINVAAGLFLITTLIQLLRNDEEIC